MDDMANTCVMKKVKWKYSQQYILPFKSAKKFIELSGNQQTPNTMTIIISILFVLLVRALSWASLEDDRGPPGLSLDLLFNLCMTEA